jgi:hypothetical protein
VYSIYLVYSLLNEAWESLLYTPCSVELERLTKTRYRGLPLTGGRPPINKSKDLRKHAINLSMKPTNSKGNRRGKKT